jgi:hypothetical protein
MLGSPAATSTILVRLKAPVTSVTAPRRTPNAVATAASAASVALPSTARALTRTTRTSACPPPTPGRDEPGRTRIVIRIRLVCGEAGSGGAWNSSTYGNQPVNTPAPRRPPLCQKTAPGTPKGHPGNESAPYRLRPNPG